MEKRLAISILPRVASELPVHPRPLALWALTGREPSAAVAALREELAEQACEEHGLASARGAAAGRALRLLAGSGETAGALRLVVAGAPLDVQDESGCTALIRAVSVAGDFVEHATDDGTRWNEHNEIVTALIGARAPLDVQEQRGETALMLAAQDGRTGIAMALIGAGAQLDLQDKTGKTALMWAAKQGHLEIASALAEAGADMDLEDQHYDTAISLASYNWHFRLAGQLAMKEWHQLPQ